MVKEKEQIRICTNHDKKVPLIWTFSFPGSEYWCPACGFNGGMWGSGTLVNATPTLKKSADEWVKKSKAYLNAEATFSCHSMKIKGKDVLQKDIPEKMKDDARKIINEWKYVID